MPAFQFAHRLAIALPVAALESNPAALRQRVIRLAIEGEFGVTPSRTQTLAVARLVSDWHGQGSVSLPGLTVERREGRLHFAAADPEPRRNPDR